MRRVRLRVRCTNIAVVTALPKTGFNTLLLFFGQNHRLPQIVVQFNKRQSETCPLQASGGQPGSRQVVLPPVNRTSHPGTKRRGRF